MSLNSRVKTSHHRLLFVLVIVLIYWATYSAYASMNNVVQDLASWQHLDPKLYPWLIIIAERISLVAAAFCMLDSLQAIHRQRWLFISLLGALSICLWIPFSIRLFPFISGLESIIFTLIEPWLQLYIPPALRATISALSIGLTGVFDISSAEFEDNWMTHLFRYRYFAVLFAILLLFFWRLSNSSKLNKGLPPMVYAPKSVIFLLTKHPYIFIAYFFAGLNYSLFDFTFVLAQEIISSGSLSPYQDTLYLGGIIVPIAMGVLADKKGIFKVLLCAAMVLIAVELITGMAFKLSVHTTILYFILAFIEGGLAITACSLSASLIGERLKTQGIFRSFAMSGMLFSLGILCSGYLYEFCAGSFFLTKIIIGVCNSILLILLWKSYRDDSTATG